MASPQTTSPLSRSGLASESDNSAYLSKWSLSCHITFVYVRQVFFVAGYNKVAGLGARLACLLNLAITLSPAKFFLLLVHKALIQLAVSE